MINGKCPKCGSDQVFKKKNGVISDSKCVYVRGLSTFTPPSDRLTCVCAKCGYYENYLMDNGALDKIPRKWTKVRGTA